MPVSIFDVDLLRGLLMLIRHSILYSVAKFLPGLLGIVTTGILTHLFEPNQYGVYGLIIVAMTLIANICFDWLGVSFLRFYDGGKDDPHILGTFLHLFALLMVISATVGCPVLFFGSMKAISVPFCMLGVVLAWVYSAFEMISRFEIANFRPFRYLAMNLARGFLTLLGAVGGAWFTNDPIWAAVGTGAGMLLSICVGTARISPMGVRHFNRELASRVLRFGIPLAISTTFAALITGATRPLLEVLDSREALGLYTAAFVLIQNSLSVLGAGISSISFQLAVRAVDSGDLVLQRRQFLGNGTVLLAVLMPATVGMMLTAQDIATTFVGPKFQATVTILTPWLAAAGFFGSLRAYFLDYAFQFGNRPSAQAWVTAIAAVAAIALSVYLIPHYGPLGAAIAVTTALFISCGLAAVVGRYIHLRPFSGGSSGSHSDLLRHHGHTRNHCTGAWANCLDFQDRNRCYRIFLWRDCT